MLPLSLMLPPECHLKLEWYSGTVSAPTPGETTGTRAPSTALGLYMVVLSARHAAKKVKSPTEL